MCFPGIGWISFPRHPDQLQSKQMFGVLNQTIDQCNTAFLTLDVCKLVSVTLTKNLSEEKSSVVPILHIFSYIGTPYVVNKISYINFWVISLV